MLTIVWIYISQLYIEREFSPQNFANSSSYLIHPKHIAILHLELGILLSNPVVSRIQLLIGDVCQYGGPSLFCNLLTENSPGLP